MKIAVVTESFLPQVNGVTNSVLRVLETLRDHGHEALVIAPEGGDVPREYAGHRVKTINSLQVQNVLPVGMPMGLPSRKLLHILDGFAPDVLHIASPFALGAYTSRIAKRLKVPTLSVYQTDIAGFAKHYGMNLAHGALRKMVGKIHAQTDRTLAPSTSACRELSEQGVENVHLWRRGVNTELFNPSAYESSLRKIWDPTGKKLIVGYVGRLANEKRIYDLRFLAQDQTIQVLITGEGPARAKLEKEMPDAIFLGFKSGNELARIYASLDIFVHPGPNETFCQAVQEALASGTPCIVPTTGGPCDLVTHGITGYVINTHRSDELEAAIIHFKLRNDRAKMREDARSSVEMRTWKYVNDQLLNHYQELLQANQINLKGSVA